MKCIKEATVKGRYTNAVMRLVFLLLLFSGATAIPSILQGIFGDGNTDQPEWADRISTDLLTQDATSGCNGNYTGPENNGTDGYFTWGPDTNGTDVGVTEDMQTDGFTLTPETSYPDGGFTGYQWTNVFTMQPQTDEPHSETTQGSWTKIGNTNFPGVSDGFTLDVSTHQPSKELSSEPVKQYREIFDNFRKMLRDSVGCRFNQKRLEREFNRLTTNGVDLTISKIDIDPSTAKEKSEIVVKTANGQSSSFQMFFDFLQQYQRTHTETTTNLAHVTDENGEVLVGEYLVTFMIYDEPRTGFNYLSKLVLHLVKTGERYAIDRINIINLTDTITNRD